MLQQFKTYSTASAELNNNGTTLSGSSSSRSQKFASQSIRVENGQRRPTRGFQQDAVVAGKLIPTHNQGGANNNIVGCRQQKRCVSWTNQKSYGPTLQLTHTLTNTLKTIHRVQRSCEIRRIAAVVPANRRPRLPRRCKRTM